MNTKAVDELLTFLRRFDGGDFVDADARYRATGRYPDLVIDLTHAIYRSELTIPFKWLAWKRHATKYARKRGLLETARLETIKRMLTVSVRQDRFAGGLMPMLCSSGLMQACLERLAVLRRRYRPPALPNQALNPPGPRPAG
jgi:hypothetical protein